MLNTADEERLFECQREKWIPAEDVEKKTISSNCFGLVNTKNILSMQPLSLSITLKWTLSLRKSFTSDGLM